MESHKERQEAWDKREQERTVKLGEIRGRVLKGIKTTDDVRIWIDHIEALRFKPSEDLKNGDTIKVTIEKV
jgi:hypothetical protein